MYNNNMPALTSHRRNVSLCPKKMHLVLLWPWPLTLELWPWKPFQQYRLIWRIFVASFIEIFLLNAQILRHAKQLLDLAVTLIFNIRPWKSVLQCPLTWWLLVPSFIEIPPPSEEISCHVE